MKRQAERMSDANRSKAQRGLNARLSLPHMSTSAVVAAMKFAQNSNVEDMPSSRIAYSLAKVCSLEDTPYGSLVVAPPLVPTPPHANRELVVINPFAY